MDSACPEKDATEILSDSDHWTKVAPTTLTCSIRTGETAVFWAVADGVVYLSGQVLRFQLWRDPTRITLTVVIVTLYTDDS